MANHPNRSQQHNGNHPPPAKTGTSLETYDFGDEADAVMSARREEQTIPFLRMAQGLSPELNPSKGEYIQGLALGQIFNKATQEVYDGRKGIPIVVCYKDYGYGLWIPRDLGGGFRGMLPPDHKLVTNLLTRIGKKYGMNNARFRLPRYDGKTHQWSDDPAVTEDAGEAVEVVETGQLYVLYGREQITSNNCEKAIVAFTKTALPQYTSYIDRHMKKTWPQRDGSRSPATLYTYRWKLSTFQDVRKAGEFINWKIDLEAAYDPPPDFPKDQHYDRYVASMIARDDPLHDEARNFFEQIRDGIVRPDYSMSDDDVSSNGRGPTVDPDAPPF